MVGPQRRPPLVVPTEGRSIIAATRDIARTYEVYAAASRALDPAAPVLGAWFHAWWGDHCPIEPDAGPDAISDDGAGGRGVRWYAQGEVVVGYVPGCHACYQIPLAAPLPPFAADDHPEERTML